MRDIIPSSPAVCHEFQRQATCFAPPPHRQFVRNGLDFTIDQTSDTSFAAISEVNSLKTIVSSLSIAPRYLHNKIQLLSLLICLSGPFINLWLNWKFNQTDYTIVGVIAWFFVGVHCIGLTFCMGQIIDWIAHGFNLLNFVPTLGSCIMAVVSTLSMVAVLKAIPDYMAPVRTLPLFWLIFAHSYAPTLASNHNEFIEPNHLYSTFSFYAGKAESSVLDRLFQSLIGRHITISDESLIIFQKLQQRSRSHYCKGEKSDQFKQDFQAWKTCLPHFQRVFFRRRMLCLAAFVLESGVVFLSFAALKQIFVREAGASWVELSSLEVLSCVWLSLFSDYLRAAVMVEFTFSTMAEHRAMMLLKMQSKCFDWSGFGAHQASFLTNGRPVSLCVWPSEQRYLPFRDAATIGLVLDAQESLRAGTPVLLGVETGRKLRVYRRRGLLLGTQVHRNIGFGLWAQEFSDMGMDVNWEECLLS